MSPPTLRPHVVSSAAFNFATLEAPLHSTVALHALLTSTLSAQPTGLQAAHLQTMLGLCRAFNLIIGIRPVSKHASYLIGTLEYPTKPMAVKAKTAHLGPAAGHVPAPDPTPDGSASSDRSEDLQRSQSIEATDAPIRPTSAGARAENKAEKEPDSAQAVRLPLLLTGERINELLREGILKSRSGAPPISDQSDNRHVDCLHVDCIVSGRSYVLRRQNQEQANYLRSSIHRGGAWSVLELRPHHREQNAVIEKPVYVLGHPELEKPYTADYDLMTFGLHRPDPMSSLHSLPPIQLENSLDELVSARRSLSMRPSAEGLSSQSGRLNVEDAEWGNASPFFRSLARCINACINRGGNTALQLIHHNADCHNPYSSEASIYPALFLLPNPAALPMSDILMNARADAPALLETLRRLNGTQPDMQPDIRWHNWGAIWVTDHIEFNRLASTAIRFGYVIKKSQAWLGGEIVPGSNS